MTQMKGMLHSEDSVQHDMLLFLYSLNRCLTCRGPRNDAELGKVFGQVLNHTFFVKACDRIDFILSLILQIAHQDL